MIPPSKLNERGPAKSIRVKINQVIEYAKSLRAAKSPKELVKHTSTGTIHLPIGKAVDPVDSVEVQRFSINSVAEKWLSCHKVDKTGAIVSTGTLHKVMRPLKLRGDGGLPPGYQTGTLVEGDASPGQYRTYEYILPADPLGPTYKVEQRIDPLYAPGDFLYGVNNVTGGTENDDDGTQLEWLDLNVDGRHWIREMKDIEICVDDAIVPAVGMVFKETS